MPFKTRRSSTRGTPLGLLGSSDSITRHSKSVRSYRLMPMLNQTSAGGESDLRTSVRMMLCAIPLQPVDAAFERLAELACRRDFQTRPAAVNLLIQFDQAQLGQIFLMIDDAATLA